MKKFMAARYSLLATAFPLIAVVASSFLLIPNAFAEEALSKKAVKHYLRTAIALGHLQDEIKSQPGKYADMPLAYREQGNALLNKRGYQRGEYEAVQDRVFNARNALDARVDWPERNHQAEQERILACGEDARAPSLSIERQQQMLAALRAAGASQHDIALVEANFAPAPEQREAACKAATAAKQQELDVQAAVKAQTGPDWQAVEKYRDKIDALSDWRAGNRSKPPKI